MLIEQALQNADLDEEELAYQLACKKMKIGKNGEAELKEQMDVNAVNKLVRYLQTNGFPLGTAFRVIKKINRGIETAQWVID